MGTAIYSTPEPGTLFYVYYYGMFSIIASVNIPGNILVIRTVMRTPNLRQPCNFYIVSLAVTDLLIGFIYPVYNISHLEHVPEISRPLGKKFTSESPSLDFTMKLNVAIFIFKKICNEHLKKKNKIQYLVYLFGRYHYRRQKHRAMIDDSKTQSSQYLS